MRALTLRQPWAWMVVHGNKFIENRVWTTKFRGEFLIHAAKGMTREEYQVALDFAYGVQPELRTFAIIGSEALGGPWSKFIPDFEDLERGGIVGRATLKDVLDPPKEQMGWQHGWRMEGQFGFVLENIRPVPFIPCRGNRRWWNYDSCTTCGALTRVEGSVCSNAWHVKEVA